MVLPPPPSKEIYQGTILNPKQWILQELISVFFFLSFLFFFFFFLQYLAHYCYCRKSYLHIYLYSDGGYFFLKCLNYL